MSLTTSFDEEIKAYLIPLGLGEQSISSIINLVRKGNYLQLIYSYDSLVVNELLQYFLSKENYEQCEAIRLTVYNHNKATGSQIKLIV